MVQSVKKWKCHICTKEYGDRRDLKRHNQAQHLNVRFECSVCLKSYAYARDLRRHTQSNHSNKRWYCDICGKSYVLSTALNVHMKTFHIGRKWNCELCQKDFHTAFGFRKHKIHVHQLREENSASCTYCHRVFETKEELIYHENIFHVFACDICAKVFPTGSLQKNHILQAHSEESEFKFMCEICCTKFTRSKDLTRHFDTHLDLK